MGSRRRVKPQSATATTIPYNGLICTLSLLFCGGYSNVLGEQLMITIDIIVGFDSLDTQPVISYWIASKSSRGQAQSRRRPARIRQREPLAGLEPPVAHPQSD